MIQTTPLKTAIVCMVYNGLEYLSEFIHYHLLLCDHIYVIDHNSEIDLRQIKLDRVTFVRSSHEAQFQSECTNIVIEHFGIKKNYNWLFVLDIDEFLPFTDRAAFHAFLKKHGRDNVLQFNWRNGVPFYDPEAEQPHSLIDCESIRFFYKNSPHYKAFVNINKTKKNFVVTTGAHRITRIYNFKFFNFLRRKPKDYIAAISERPLLHIVAFNKNAFLKKIKNYVDQMKYREHIKGQGGWVVRDYPDTLSNDQWLWYIANFRVNNAEQFYECSIDNFVEADVFSHLSQDQVVTLRNSVAALKKTEKKKATPEEKRYLSHKQDDQDIVENIKWFAINSANEIITIIPHTQREAQKL